MTIEINKRTTLKIGSMYMLDMGVCKSSYDTRNIEPDRCYIYIDIDLTIKGKTRNAKFKQCFMDTAPNDIRNIITMGKEYYLSGNGKRYHLRLFCLDSTMQRDKMLEDYQRVRTYMDQHGDTYWTQDYLQWRYRYLFDDIDRDMVTYSILPGEDMIEYRVMKEFDRIADMYIDTLKKISNRI